MTRKSVRMTARVDPEIGESIRRAAALKGESVSAFVGAAAADHADRVLSSDYVTVLPSEFFDRLLQDPDEPDEPIPSLARVAERMRGRIRRR